MMQDPEDSRRSLESEVSTTVDTTATPEKGPNLESQFLRQSSQSSQKNEYYMRDTSSVSSANSGGGGMIRSPSTTSVGTDQRAKKRRNPNAVAYTATTLNYHGVNIYQACAQGNLPVVVLLWGMASSKRVTLMDRDFQGNNPMHYAAMAGNTEVSLHCTLHSCSRVLSFDCFLAETAVACFVVVYSYSCVASVLTINVMM